LEFLSAIMQHARLVQDCQGGGMCFARDGLAEKEEYKSKSVGGGYCWYKWWHLLQ